MGKILYLGTDPSRYQTSSEIVHVPLIQIRPLFLSQEILAEFPLFTHVILTSPNSVPILIQQVTFQHQLILAIGTGTATALLEKGLKPHAVAQRESQEGMIDLLTYVPLKETYLFYPRSSLARPLLATYLQDRGFKHKICDLYDTVLLRPTSIPSFNEFDEIVFTSPSTVRAFIQLYGDVPQDKKLTCLGPVTQSVLTKVTESTHSEWF